MDIQDAKNVLRALRLAAAFIVTPAPETRIESNKKPEPIIELKMPARTRERRRPTRGSGGKPPHAESEQ